VRILASGVQHTLLEVRVDTSPFFQGNEVLLLFLVFALLVGAGLAGYRLGRRAAATAAAEKAKSQISVIEASLVGVLGLLLGFTMSMAVSRYEARRQLVLEEANAIGTSWLRTRLLPEPQGSEIADLLRQYLDLRVEYAEAGESLDEVQAVRRKVSALQSQFWRRAVEYGRNSSDPVRAGLLLQSLNEVIDLENARWIGLFNHVPPAVICLDTVVALLSAMLVGYGFGIEGVRQIFSMCLLGAAISIALGVIIDLDRPRAGFIRVSQQPIQELQSALSAPRP